MIADKVEKVLIVERGEMGLRALKACTDMGIGFVVGFSQADGDSLLVKKALEYSKNIEGSGATYIGAEPIEESYGNVSNIIETAKLWGCDTVYPGYGPLAEDYVSIKKIEKANLKFIGPRSDVVKIFSSRLKSRELAEKYGLKLLTAFDISSADKIARICLDGKVKYPFIIKSFFSSGGRGNYLINSDEELAKILSDIDIKAGQYYAEEYVSGKHIELQFLADAKKVQLLGTRDCSCQVNFQKFLEECPAEVQDKKIEKIGKKISQILVGMGYRGVGTAEFIYDEKKKEYYFLEINPRIQVEVPVTEKIFNIDLVKSQFLIARGQEIRLSAKKPPTSHALEARIYARDICHDFKQDSRKIEKLQWLQTKNVEFFSSYQKGDIMPASYDPLILKIVSQGRSRKEAIQHLKETLQNLIIEGPATNQKLILWLLTLGKFKDNQIVQDFTQPAWNKYLKDKDNQIENFLKEGDFAEHKYKSAMNPDKFPNKLQYFRKGVARDYIKELKNKHKSDGKKCAFRFGIFKKNNVSCIFAWWDFAYFGGTLGVDEAIGIKKCFFLANRKKLPVLMVSNSGGARQQENAFALHAMHYAVSIRKKYGVPLFINIYYEDNFGGLNASLIEQADIKIAVKGSRIGLTGPEFLSRIMTKEGMTAESQSVGQHYRARNIDLFADNIGEACQQALAIFDLLFYSENNIPNKSYKNSNEADSFSDNKKNDLSKNQRSVSFGLIEILNPDLNIFESVAWLANKDNDKEAFPAIAGAFVKIGRKKALVLGQYVPITKKNDNSLEKKYPYPCTADFKWFRRKMKLAEKLKIPLILFGDTLGADASLKSEYDGISYYISHALSDQLDLTVPVVSVNMGLCGSGGGLPFVNTADLATAFGNSLKLVADIGVQSSIMTGTSKPTAKQQNDILDQLADATAKSQKKYHFIDEVIAEKNKQAAASALKKFLIGSLEKLSSLSVDKLRARRFHRIERAIKVISQP